MALNMGKTIIFYHGKCPDGFGGAFAAWKKFGDSAEYVPLLRGEEPPVQKAQGADVLFIDFCYPKEIMDQFIEEAKSLVMLDHHEGMKEVVESMPEYRYGDNSGAVIAWKYFHPDTNVPTLLNYIEEGDLYRFTLPDVHSILSYVYTRPFTFQSWDELSVELESTARKEEIIKIGKTFSEHNEILMKQIAESADLINFEGYVCYLASTSRQFSSYVGNTLARKQPPLAVIASVDPTGIKVSLRGDGSVDVSKIAQKFGGNGHPNSAGFILPWGVPIPWTPYEDTLN